jgi:hypothetical protein
MKLWAMLTVGAYCILLAALAGPLLIVTMGDWHLQNDSPLTFHQALQVYPGAGLWIWIAVLGLCNAILIAPLSRPASTRPKGRRTILAPIITGAFLFANLVLAAVVSIASAIGGDKGMDFFAASGQKLLSAVIHSETAYYISGMGIAFLIAWSAWGFIFYRTWKSDDSSTVIDRLMHWMLRGSVLELLIAVPCHVIVRRRHDCCAPAATFWGIATGLSIMLMAFGPGVLFLFAKRCARLRKAHLPA